MDVDLFEGFDNQDDENRGVNREMNDTEKEAMDRWKQEDEELDNVIGDIDNAMDGLLAGIDNVGENLKDQADQIDKINKLVDPLQKDLNKTALKLKNQVKKWKTAGNASIQIVMLVILMMLVGVLIYILQNLYL